MRTVVAMAVIATAIGAAALFTPAQAQHYASGWHCRAESGYAWGEGWSPYQNQAQQNALYQCAARTPQGATCFVINCHFD